MLNYSQNALSSRISNMKCNVMVTVSSLQIRIYQRDSIVKNMSPQALFIDTFIPQTAHVQGKARRGEGGGKNGGITVKDI